MEVVLDSNVLFRTLISGGDILDLIFDNELKIYAPLKLSEEVQNNKEEILLKSKLSEKDFNELVSLISEKVNWVSKENYEASLSKADRILEDHKKDREFIALCISKDIKLWTYENRLLNTGYGVTTKEISESLK